ncbi:AMSH-like ubiquitin thioesterase 3 [Quercus suber]|uniref:AMSH-like ubiquitin thioesterase 3 n=1 Tax=Quercus suber TaxID=58331 RepID=UPI0032DFE8C0
MKINVDSIARKVEVDHRIPLRHYYRIADNLLKQASIYREEKNVVDLYIILLRYSSLVSETIPFHRDYQVLLPKERINYKKRLSAVLDELESLKPEFQRRVDELNEGHSGAGLPQLDGLELNSFGSEMYSLEWPAVNKNSYSSDLWNDHSAKIGLMLKGILLIQTSRQDLKKILSSRIDTESTGMWDTIEQSISSYSFMAKH